MVAALLGVSAISAAAALNLEVAWPYRILIVTAMGWAILMGVMVVQLCARIGRIEYWSRKTFVALRVSNEANDLRYPIERSEEYEQNIEFEREGWHPQAIAIDVIVYSAAIALFLALLGVVLNAGLVGPYGENWIGNGSSTLQVDLVAVRRHECVMPAVL